MTAPALPRTCAPVRLWLRLGHVVYLGPSLRLGPHASAVACLGVGLDAPFTVRADGAPDLTVRSFLFRARARYEIRDGAGRMLYCYFDPTSARMARCLGGMRRVTGGLSSDHRHEADLIDLATRDEVDYERLLAAASIPALSAVDPRIADAAARIRTDPARAQRAETAARKAGLSRSHFLRKFSDQTGTSFRRYVQWARILHVAAAFADGHDFTRAAADAGFASPSHFTDTFRGMFGLTPTALAALNPQFLFDEQDLGR
ncbi:MULTISPECIES: helix-turn-helix transcriptional regulator [Actinomadura]|uniref:Helix-turn-helix transcriptional regulator n=1 Tax=Actinomadura yumaensis TaxID=111807 RepID=A0ABW2CI46_9ACTN|nr:AraC family transcriptional regulator [Actinomadura sp. J1-007]MWK37103.1 helix-turn-helix domain-containing protein [Actinomadura sp. J1-007]